MANSPTSKDEPDSVEDAEVIDEIPPVVVEEPETPEEPEPTPQDEEDIPEADSGEDDAPAADEPASEAPQPKEQPAPRRGGIGFVGLVVGGIIAGAIGFGAAVAVFPDGTPFAGPPAEDPLVGIVDAQGAQIAELRALTEAQAQAIEGLTADTSLDDAAAALRADIVATQTRIETLSGTIARFDERISSLEKMPAGDSAEAAQAAAAAYERELAEMREMLEAEIAALKETQSETAALEVSAADAARAAAKRAALSRIMAALDSGRPFGDALFDLTQSAGIAAPEALTNVAESGVPTLPTLQEGFPDAARAALDGALRDMVANGEIGRGEAFLRTQLGTRSLEPQEGDDPDAVLSRAEFALRSGDIDAALAELATMRDAAQPALADWIALAETRRDALVAGAALATQLSQ